MKHKVYIIIPFKNSSARLRSKNEILLHFTLDWLEKELAALGLDGVGVYTYGNISTATRKWLAALGVEHVKLSHHEDTGHRAATIAALTHLGAGAQNKIIMLQVTQPARRAGLLGEALEALDNQDLPIITATRVHVDGRALTSKGQRVARQSDNLLLYDGALYGGRLATLENWWTLERPSKVLINQEISVIDIDTPQDLLKHTTWKA